MIRRTFLKGALASAAFVLFGNRAARGQGWSGYRFQHGVASGDPLADGIILWTRVSGAGSGPLRVEWEIAKDRGMLRTVQRGSTWTDDYNDYTVKVDVRKLRPGQTYYYRFSLYGDASPVGRTRTLPEGEVASASLAVVSCSNFPYGYFHAYREIAKRDDLDAVVHLGDYIYEYGSGEYGTEYAEALGRVPEPAHELLSLEDYRLRHAQYKSDPDAQAMHAAHPFISIWDDHEITNDAWRAGAANHQDGEGDYAERVQKGVQAYFEWMPIRGAAAGGRTRIFREFTFGNLMSLIMLDTRLFGRDIQPDVQVGAEPVTEESVRAALADPERRMLGSYQEQWLRRKLSASKATWQVLGQQVMMAPLYSPDLEPLLDLSKESMVSPELLQRNIALSKSNPPLLLDTWDGYPVAREQLLADLEAHARNPVVISGDLHTAMGNELVPRGKEHPVAVEFMTTSVSSPGFAEYLPEVRQGAIRDAAQALNPWVKYMDTDHRGWLRVDVTHERCSAEWHLLDTVHAPEYAPTIDRQLSVRAGKINEGLA
jgi:alkaline phosphatase D